MAGDPSADQTEAIIADPNWLPHPVRDDGRTLEFMHLSRENLGELSFVEALAADAKLFDLSLPESEATAITKDPLYRSGWNCNRLSSAGRL